MGEGADKAAWNRTAAVLAQFAAANKKPGTPKPKPDQFHPYARR